MHICISVLFILILVLHIFINSLMPFGFIFIVNLPLNHVYIGIIQSMWETFYSHTKSKLCTVFFWIVASTTGTDQNARIL